MGNELSVLEKESRLDELHSKALEVCYSLMDGKNLKRALLDNGITARNFFDQKRIHQDIKKAYLDAEEVRAELKMAELDELSDDLLMENDLNKDTYTAVSNTIKWSIGKLLPDKYGTKPNIQNASYTQNNISLMSTLTDEQLLSIMNGGSLGTLPPGIEKGNSSEIIDVDVKKGVDKSKEPEYNSRVEEKSGINTLLRPYTQNIASTSEGSMDAEHAKNFSFCYKSGKTEPSENPLKNKTDNQVENQAENQSEKQPATLPETKQENQTGQPTGHPAEFDLSIFSRIG